MVLRILQGSLGRSRNTNGKMTCDKNSEKKKKKLDSISSIDYRKVLSVTFPNYLQTNVKHTGEQAYR